MKKTFTSLLLIFLILLLSLSPSFAAIPNQAQGLTISPPLFDLNLEPGKSYNEQIKLNNPTTNIIEMYPIARNFTASDDESGTPTIESPDQSATYGLATWITFDQPKIVLTPDQEVTFKYTIKVPTDAEPGGHYASVLFASQPPTPDKNVSQVALASMVGSLILGKVSGAITEDASLREFTTSKYINLKPPVDFTLRIANSGNVHVKPIGEILVSNFGRTSASLDINPQKGNILPSSVRRFNNLSFNTHWWNIGYFSAKLVCTYGDKNEVLTGLIHFWIIPWWLIAIIAFIILSIIFIIWRRRRRRRRRKPIVEFKNSNQSSNGPQAPPPVKKRIILQ